MPKTYDNHSNILKHLCATFSPVALRTYTIQAEHNQLNASRTSRPYRRLTLPMTHLRKTKWITGLLALNEWVIFRAPTAEGDRDPVPRPEGDALGCAGFGLRMSHRLVGCEEKKRRVCLWCRFKRYLYSRDRYNASSSTQRERERERTNVSDWFISFNVNPVDVLLVWLWVIWMLSTRLRQYEYKGVFTAGK